MKYSYLLLLMIFPALVSGQTPSLYDTWTPTILGSDPYVTINTNEFSIHHASRIDYTFKFTKIIFDSLQAKGRVFFPLRSNSRKQKQHFIGVSFILKDNGAMMACLAEDLLDSKPKTLKEAEKTSALAFHQNTLTDNWYYLYNQKAVSALAQLKSVDTIGKDELVVIIDSFRNKIVGVLPQISINDPALKDHPQISSLVFTIIRKYFQEFHDILVAHGYNPIVKAGWFERIIADPEIFSVWQTIANLIQDKLEELTKNK